MIDCDEISKTWYVPKFKYWHRFTKNFSNKKPRNYQKYVKIPSIGVIDKNNNMIFACDYLQSANPDSNLKNIYKIVWSNDLLTYILECLYTNDTLYKAEEYSGRINRFFVNTDEFGNLDKGEIGRVFLRIIGNQFENDINEIIKKYGGGNYEK